MRIVGGRFRGRHLASPGARVRPTAEPVRDALMSVLRDDLKGARILDLFAGTGALGLESLSRGASRVDFVENGPESLHALKANVAALRLRKKARIFKRDALPFAAALDPLAYDVAFADPPYGSRMLDKLLEGWAERPFSRILVVEPAADHRLPFPGERYEFGDTAVTLFRAPEAPGDPEEATDGDGG
jgi:16S rRNA (guanine966-N2)-methyltransferase